MKRPGTQAIVLQIQTAVVSLHTPDITTLRILREEQKSILVHKLWKVGRVSHNTPVALLGMSV